MPGWILTDDATVAMHKDIKLAVEITVTPCLKALDASRVIQTCYRVNKSPAPCNSNTAWPDPQFYGGQHSNANCRSGYLLPPLLLLADHIIGWCTGVYADRQALSAWLMSFSSSKAASRTPVSIQYISTGDYARVPALMDTSSCGQAWVSCYPEGALQHYLVVPPPV